MSERLLPTAAVPWWVRDVDFEDSLRVETVQDATAGLVARTWRGMYRRVDNESFVWIEPVTPPGDAAELRKQVIALTDEVAALRAQLDEIAPHVEAGRLFNADGTEVPTTVAERAKWTAAALAAESDNDDVPEGWYCVSDDAWSQGTRYDGSIQTINSGRNWEIYLEGELRGSAPSANHAMRLADAIYAEPVLFEILPNSVNDRESTWFREGHSYIEALTLLVRELLALGAVVCRRYNARRPGVERYRHYTLYEIRDGVPLFSEEIE